MEEIYILVLLNDHDQADITVKAFRLWEDLTNGLLALAAELTADPADIDLLNQLRLWLEDADLMLELPNNLKAFVSKEEVQ